MIPTPTQHDFDALLDSVEVFFGQTNLAMARVYARLPAEGLPSDTTLCGLVHGPNTPYAHTLPARAPFVDRGRTQSLLAEATVTDPCDWSPQMPFLYAALLELRVAGKVVAQSTQAIGLRRLHAKRNSLVLAGNRWVLRGVRHETLDVDVLRAAREAEVALCVPHLEDVAMCELASQIGVMLVSDLRNTIHSADGLLTAVARYSRWPAVGMVLVGDGFQLPEQLTAPLPRWPLVACAARDARSAIEVVPAAQIIAREGVAADKPIVALADNNLAVPLADARRAIDALQRGLASYGDYAGYIV